MGYGISDREAIEWLHALRWQFQKGEIEFEGLDVNLMLETCVDKLDRLTPEPRREECA